VTFTAEQSTAVFEGAAGVGSVIIAGCGQQWGTVVVVVVVVVVVRSVRYSGQCTGCTTTGSSFDCQ